MLSRQVTHEKSGLAIKAWGQSRVHAFFANLKRKIDFQILRHQRRAATLKWLAYLLFILTLTGVVTFFKFPYGSIQSRLEASIAERWDLNLVVTDLRPTLPPKLSFDRFSVRSPHYGGVSVFHGTEGYLRPRLLPLFWGKLAATIHIEAYGGFLDGFISLKPFYDVRNYSLEASWQSMHLEEHSGLLLLLERQLSGKLSGELELVGPLNELSNASGIVTLVLTEATCPIEHPYFKMKNVEELEVTASLKLNSGEMEIENSRFQARGIKGTLSGVVQLQPRLFESVLDLAGQCQIDPALLNLSGGSNRGLVSLLDESKPLPFHIRGTVTAPRLSLF